MSISVTKVVRGDSHVDDDGRGKAFHENQEYDDGKYAALYGVMVDVVDRRLDEFGLVINYLYFHVLGHAVLDLGEFLLYAFGNFNEVGA